MLLSEEKDFIIPVLEILDSLGGEAGLLDIKEAFYKRFASSLDPSVDWSEITKNHNEARWKDYCGSRLSTNYLLPLGLITKESHGSKGSKWKITDKGRERLKGGR